MDKQSNVWCPCKISCIQFIAMGGIEKGWGFFFFFSPCNFFFNAITESMWKTSCFMHLVRLKTNTGRTGCLQAACAWQLPGREGDAGEMSWNDLSPRSIYKIYFTRLNPLSITLAGAAQKESKERCCYSSLKKGSKSTSPYQNVSLHQSPFNRKPPEE